MGVWDGFKIRQGSTEPGGFKLAANGGAAVLTGLIPTADLEYILQNGVETATADNATGKIRRTNPVSHPRFNHLFLRTVDNVVGRSFIQKEAADPEGYLEVDPIPYFSDYREYEVTTTFEPRPYALITDAHITDGAYDIDYFDTDGTSQTKSAFPEYERNVEWMRSPAAEWLTADQGVWVWSNTGGLGDAATGPKDKTNAGTGQIRQLMPASTWKIRWYCVPYSYVLSDNTYFERYVGYVNQQEIFGWQPGQALLQAVNVLNVYTPPFPEFTDYTGSLSPSQDKLCDLEFVILSTPKLATYRFSPDNDSYVIDGHNSQFYQFNQKPYYVSHRFAADAVEAGTPPFPSFPLDLLFQNPDGP